MRAHSLLTFALVAIPAIGCVPSAADFEAGHTSSARDVAANEVRVATWNIERVGVPGSDEFEAAVDVLARLDADVVVLNEIAGITEAAYADDLAAAAGFTEAFGADLTPLSGYQRNAILSRLPVVATDSYDSVDLSGDPEAHDMSRIILRMTVMSASGDELTVLAGHWKSGVNNRNELRRIITSIRTSQAILDLDAERDSIVIMGDMNAEQDLVEVPASFSELPSGMPASWVLGSDLQETLAAGLDNDPFAPLEEAGLRTLDLVQRDGDDATREGSGKRLDYIWTSLGVHDQPWAGMVFDCAEEDLVSPIELAGEAVSADACTIASDHLPVVADVVIGEEYALDIDSLQAGDLVLSELLPDPSQCSDNYGEWVELYNASPYTVRLEGLDLVDASGRSGTLSGGSIAAGEHAVVGRSDAERYCGTADAVGFYGSNMSLNNTGDSVRLLAGDVTVDEAAAYGATDRDTSIQLSADWLDASGNDDETHWCDSPTTTPGLENDLCE